MPEMVNVPVPNYYILNYSDFYGEILSGWDNVNLDEYEEEYEDTQMTEYEYDSTTEYNSYSDCEFDLHSIDTQ